MQLNGEGTAVSVSRRQSRLDSQEVKKMQRNADHIGYHWVK